MDGLLADRAAEQHGVFTAAQATAIGFSDEQIRRRVESGRYVKYEQGVLIVAGSPRTRLQDIASAVLSVGSRAAASHRTAAELWNMSSGRAAKIEVVTRRWRREHRHFVVHESMDLQPSDVETVRGIPTTSAVRTVVDLGATAPIWLVEHCLDDGLRSGLFGIDDVDRFVRRVARRGRRGVGVIRPLVDERRSWTTPSESPLEDRFRRLVGRYGLPEPMPQYVVHDDAGVVVCRADFAYPQARLLIELDGRAFHVDKDRFQKDRSIQNAVEILGWRVLRYTWGDVMARPSMVCNQIRRVLA